MYILSLWLIIFTLQPLKLNILSKTILNFDPSFTFKVFGIVCSEKDYRLCWLLNNNCGLTLSRAEDIESKYKTGSKYFTVFTTVNLDGENIISLLKNKVEGGYFVPEKKEIDYFLTVSEHLTNTEFKSLQEDLKKIPQVLTAFEVDPESLKSKENFLSLEII
ncbi:MAG: hypothetical protein ACJAZ3_002009 [Sphingobacteriales bacterium]|jgi:hypothetical protein